eukprot:m.851643 g.851643  ORF g.851643 m.851643 type:complete len:444 (+) comp23492_c0_seq10:144-1475(+)
MQSLYGDDCVPPLLEFARFLRRNHQRIRNFDTGATCASQGDAKSLSTDPRTRLLSLRKNPVVIRWIRDRACNPDHSRLQQGLWLELIGGLLGDEDASNKAVRLLEEAIKPGISGSHDAITIEPAVHDSRLDVHDAHDDDVDDDNNLEVTIRAALARAKCAVSMAKIRRCSLLKSELSESCTSLIRNVQVYEAADLSLSNFMQRHAIPRVPCIIRGAGTANQAPLGPLSTFASLEARLKDKRGNLKRRVQGSASWASLEVAPGGPHKLDDFVAKIALDSTTDDVPPEENTKSPPPCAASPPFYLHDWSLPQFAPELAALVEIPHYFASDMLQECDDGSLLRDTWPSLFVAPRGTESALHVDSCGTHFWMQVLHGTKLWRIFPHDETALLDPIFIDGSFDPCFDPSVSELCEASSPKGMHPWECQVTSGESTRIPVDKVLSWISI